MRLTVFWGFLTDLRLAVSVALLPTLKAVARDPRLALRPREVSRLFMSFVWEVYGPGVDGNSKSVKEALVTPRARGVVLDVGAAHGHLIPYLDRTRVTAYVALEPNARMHPVLREKAAEAGFSEEEGNLLVLPYGAEEIVKIRDALMTWSMGAGKRFCSSSSSVGANDGEGGQQGTQVIDTLVLILTLCSIPKPLETLRALVRDVLVGGGDGQVLFYEHVRNPRADVAWWQDVVAPVWRHAFDGCVVGLDGVGVVRAAAGGEGGAGEGGKGIGGWKEMETWGVEGEDVESLFWHQVGRCVKA